MNTSTPLSINTKSVRFRLTALYSSTLIFSLAILFVSFYWVTKRELYNHTDAALQSHGNRIIALLTQEELLTDKQMSSQLLADIFSEAPGMIALVTDNEGNVLTISQRADNLDDVVAKLFAKIKSSKDPVFLNQSWGSEGMRFILIPIFSNGTLRNVMMMGHPIDVIDTSLRSLYGSLTLVFLSFVIPTIFGGFMLAGSALRPVAQISQELEEISSENLKRRVSIPHTHDEIETLSHTFNTLLDRLEESFISERQFIGDVAHELKTPLATLKGGIDVALSRVRSQKEYTKVLKDLSIDVNRLSDTLTHILDLAWSRSDSYESTKDRADVSELTREISEIAQKLAFGKHILIQTHIENGLFIRGKKEKLFRAILNVVDNAVKYSRDKSIVTIKLTKKGNQVMVQVKDTGRGITKEDLPHVFDRFYRGAKSDKTTGSGLGLSIAKAIITSYGGTIHVESTLGKGTSVTVHFPFANS